MSDLRVFVERIDERIRKVRLHIEDTEHAARAFRNELAQLEDEKKKLEGVIWQIKAATENG